MIKQIRDILLHAGHQFNDRINLRCWFAFYVIYLVMLAVLALVSLRYYDPRYHHLIQHIWLLALYLFYMSLCCTFFPAPTAWLVLLIASPVVTLLPPEVLMRHFDISVIQASRLAALTTIIIVASVGGLGTALANLNEYHIFTFLLRFGWVHKVRHTRWHLSAGRWFAVSPFGLMTAASFLPIPVDVVRWLAISNRYRRGHYFLASFLGRFIRYGLLAATATCLNLGWRSIIIIQITFIVLIGLRYVPRLIKGFKADRAAENVLTTGEVTST